VARRPPSGVDNMDDLDMKSSLSPSVKTSGLFLSVAIGGHRIELCGPLYFRDRLVPANPRERTPLHIASRVQGSGKMNVLVFHPLL
jgi:hypothetical protein